MADYAPRSGTFIHGKEYDYANIKEIPHVFIAIGSRIVPQQ
jgi:hypothetical protein